MAEGFCCNDPIVGSNQLLSCAQACVRRAAEAELAEATDAAEGAAEDAASAAGWWRWRSTWLGLGLGLGLGLVLGLGLGLPARRGGRCPRGSCSARRTRRT